MPRSGTENRKITKTLIVTLFLPFAQLIASSRNCPGLTGQVLIEVWPHPRLWREEDRLTPTVAGERQTVNPGQCARFPANRPHRYSNEGQESVRFTMVVAIPLAEGLQPGGLRSGVEEMGARIEAGRAQRPGQAEEGSSGNTDLSTLTRLCR